MGPASHVPQPCGTPGHCPPGGPAATRAPHSSHKLHPTGSPEVSGMSPVCRALGLGVAATLSLDSAAKLPKGHALEPWPGDQA